MDFSAKGQKRKRSSSKEVCIVHSDSCKNESFTYLSQIQDPSEKLRTLKDISVRRLSLPSSDQNRMTESCHSIPDEVDDSHGYHRDCYRRFTRNLDRLPNLPSTSTTEVCERPQRERHTIIFKPDCIFCNKEGRVHITKKGVRTNEETTKFEFGGGANVIAAAERKRDELLLRRISGHDLFACEAQYHSTCRRKYMRDLTPWRSEDVGAKAKQIKSEHAHQNALDAVCKVIDTDVIQGKQVMKLADLCMIYRSKLQDTEFANPDYRAEKLKVKLEKTPRYSSTLSFLLLDTTGKFQSYLLYRSDLDVVSAMKSAYKLGSGDVLGEVACGLRKDIQNSFDASNDMPWPPITDQLDITGHVIPDDLNRFLTVLFTGQSSPQSDKVKRLVSSIGQDICRAVTNGRWKLPKHILLCMTLRHLFRSAELISLISRFGHCENYSFSLELETAIANAVNQTSSMLTTQIIRQPRIPSVFHSEFDNFDQLINNLTGQGSVHTAHGIMLQDMQGPIEECGGTTHVFHNRVRSKERSLQSEQVQEPAECFISKRKSPDFVIRHWTYNEAEDAEHKAVRQQFVWLLLRTKCTVEDLKQSVPGFSGFVSNIGTKPRNLTTIDYYPVINHAITEYKTVKQCLAQAEQATNEVGQDYVITTFDLGVCMKAYPIVWNNPDRYKRHIILIGTFHLTCAYMRMIGKKMDGSGIADILIESKLVGSGSLNGVLSGKNYARAIHCHKVLLEGLERLLLRGFTNQHPNLWTHLSDRTTRVIQTFLASPSQANFQTIMEDDSLTEFIEAYHQYRAEVRTGRLGKTGQFWLTYMDHVWLVLRLDQAIKLNDFMLYSSCLTSMCDLFFSFGGQNYARYLSYFSLFIANIETSHPGSTELLQQGAISVARSFIPGSRCAVDKTMEETFMKHSKSHAGAGGGSAGLSGIVTNYSAYQRWVRSAHERTKYVEATLNMADVDKSGRGESHRDLRPTEITRSEETVRNVMETVDSFADPFSFGDTVHLFNVASGAPASSAVESDVLRAETAGTEAKENFIRDRLQKGERFFDPIKRLNLKTMADMNKTIKAKTSKGKVTELKQQGNVAIQLLVKSQGQDSHVDLKELMCYPLTPVPYSIGTADGFMAKTDKSKGFHFLTKDADDMPEPPQKDTLIIEDGNASFYCMRDVPSNFNEICLKLFNMLPGDCNFVFSTDMYKQNSIKSMERARRGMGETLVIKGGNTRKPQDWKSFLANDKNKKQLIALLLKVWSSDSLASKLTNRDIVLICEGQAFALSSDDGQKTTIKELHDLRSSQEETDSRVILYCKYGVEKGYKYIRVRSPDSDIFFILLHFAKSFLNTTILLETGKGNTKRLLNITDIAHQYTQQQCSALLGLHAFTGCDTCSAFKGKGKVKPIKLLLKHPQFTNVMDKLGESWDVSEEMLSEAEAFTCALYGKPRFKCVNELRHFLLRAKCGNKERIDHSKHIDFGTFPPCKDSLKEHVHRVNFQVAVWKHANIALPETPSPSENHGWVWKDNVLEPLWTSGDVLPQRLVDILDEGHADTDTDSSDDDSDREDPGTYLDDDASDDE